MSEQNIKVPPHDLEVEKALICSILLDEDYQEKLQDISLQPEYFYSNRHKYIYEAVIKLESSGSINVDLITLKDQLVKMSRLNDVGGIIYLAEIMNTVSTSANLLNYAEIIENKYLLRSVISTSTEAVESAYNEEEEGKVLLDKLSQDIFTLSEKKNRNTPQPLDSALISTYKKIEEWSTRDGGLSGITTGYSKLDKMTAGWQNGTLIVLAARPSMGKTQLALNFAMNAAKEKTSIGFFSLEMGRTELAMRLMSMEGKVPLGKLKTGDLRPDDWQRLGMALANLSEMPVYIDDSTSLNILELRTKCRRLKKDKDIGMIIVDYIGLMETDKGVERHEGISRISRALKGMSKELDIPVFILAQLNREVDKRPDKRPLLSDLRDSGAIEQDADIVMFILRPEFYKIKDEDGNNQEGRAIVIVGKQRSGPTGDIDLRFDKSTLRFEDNYDMQELVTNSFSQHRIRIYQ